MSKYTLDQMFSFIVDYTDVTEYDLILITKMIGWNETTMLDVLYTATGYRNFDQMFDAYDMEYEGTNYNE